MNYRKIYNRLIFKRKNLDCLSRANDYCELHHILPRSLHGTDKNENLVLLTAREHFIAHKLLERIYCAEYGEYSMEHRKMLYAIWYLTGKKKGLRITSRQYENIKRKIARCNALEFSGERHWNYGRHWTNEVKAKISRAHKGKKVKEEYRHKYRKFGKENSNYGHRWNLEQRLAASLSRKGKPLSESAKEKLKQHWKVHPNPMTGVNVKDRMSPEAYKEMLRKRSETMKKKYALGLMKRNPFEGKTQDEIDLIRERMRIGHRLRWEAMSSTEREQEREKKRRANALSHISKKKKKEMQDGIGKIDVP